MGTMEATPGIEIHENRHPQSCLASNSHFITQFQRSKSCHSPSFLMSVHGVVPNPYQTSNSKAFFAHMTINHIGFLKDMAPSLCGLFESSFAMGWLGWPDYGDGNGSRQLRHGVRCS
jgi:hypothetical protein